MDEACAVELCMNRQRVCMCEPAVMQYPWPCCPCGRPSQKANSCCSCLIAVFAVHGSPRVSLCCYCARSEYSVEGDSLVCTVQAGCACSYLVDCLIHLKLLVWSQGCGLATSGGRFAAALYLAAFVMVTLGCSARMPVWPFTDTECACTIAT